MMCVGALACLFLFISFTKVAHPPFVSDRNYPGFFKGIPLFSHWDTGVSFIWAKAPTRTGSVREENGALGAALGLRHLMISFLLFSSSFGDLVEDLFFCGAIYRVEWILVALKLNWDVCMLCLFWSHYTRGVFFFIEISISSWMKRLSWKINSL